MKCWVNYLEKPKLGLIFYATKIIKDEVNLIEKDIFASYYYFMKRNEFLKLSGVGMASTLIPAGLISLITTNSGCAKADHGSMLNTMNNVNAVTVIESDFLQLLPIPITVDNNGTLTAQITNFSLKGGQVFNVLGYQANSILGPTFRINAGAFCNIKFNNNLLEASNIHWHGLHVPAIMDGHPENIIPANSTFNYSFSISQRAGLKWYHPHAHMSTGKQVYKGLAGLFIVNDAEETALNLPSGQFELPLVIQDKRLGDTTLTYQPTMVEVMSGLMGESILVNGKASPYHEVQSQMYRLRILNGSNARIYNLAFSNNQSFTIIGNDGGLLTNPISIKSILIAPGERIDVLVDFSSFNTGEELLLINKQFTGGGNAQGKQDFSILKFKITKKVTVPFVIPNVLSTIGLINKGLITRTRVFDISNGGMNIHTGGHTINNKMFDLKRTDEIVQANAVEIWQFDNSQGTEPHPMHIHGIDFQILERIGGRNGLIPSENGWKDTVLLMPGEVVKVIVSFGKNLGKYVLHCHNLEHEDDGMMLQYQLS